MSPGYAFSTLTALALVLLALPAAAQMLPPDEAGAMERLTTSPRHGEWVAYDAGGGDTVTAWVVYPERSDAAPVVVVIHEIFGLSDWIRAVADQVAADGYIAIAPDLLSGKGPEGGGTDSFEAGGVRRAIAALDRAEVDRRLQAAAEYATDLPAAAPRAASVGFCWGGGTSFEFATAWPDLDGAVVYYGTPPDAGRMETIQAPVLGFYGGDDNRVTSTVPRTREEMENLGKRYEAVIYEGAGHGFLRAQEGRDGANMEATRQAWPRTVAFFRDVLGG